METGTELNNCTNWEPKKLKFHFLSGLDSGACSVLMFVISPSLRCYCSASQQAWHRLTHGHLSYWSDTVARLQLLSRYISLHFCVWLIVPGFHLFSPHCTAALFLFPFCLSHSFSHCFTYALSPTFLTRILSCFCPSSSLRPSTSRSHTLVATLKTVVAMVTAMCCGNVKEPNPPRITSLFKRLNSFLLFPFDFRLLSVKTK